MSIVNIALILTTVKISHCETFNDSTSDQNQETPPCPFHFRSGKFGDPSSLFQFVTNGILLPIVALFGLVSNVFSIFIFTRREMRTPINLILTGKKHSETRNSSDLSASREKFLSLPLKSFPMIGTGFQSWLREPFPLQTRLFNCSPSISNAAQELFHRSPGAFPQQPRNQASKTKCQHSSSLISSIKKRNLYFLKELHC